MTPDIRPKTKDKFSHKRHKKHRTQNTVHRTNKPQIDADSHRFVDPITYPLNPNISRHRLTPINTDF